MSTPHKPSHQENEYFAREDTEKRRRLAMAQAAAEQGSAAARPMKCPRCSATMQPVPGSVAHALVCGACHGMFLDALDLKAVDAKEGYLTHLIREMSSRTWR